MDRNRIPASRPMTLRSTAGATIQAIHAVMPRFRHNWVTLPRENANAIATIDAVMPVTARRVSASPGTPGLACSGMAGREVRTVRSSL